MSEIIIQHPNDGSGFEPFAAFELWCLAHGYADLYTLEWELLPDDVALARLDAAIAAYAESSDE